MSGLSVLEPPQNTGAWGNSCLTLAPTPWVRNAGGAEGASQGRWTLEGRGPRGSVPALPCFLFSTLHLLSLEVQNGFSMVLTCISLVFSLCTVGRKLKNGGTTMENDMGVPPKVKNRTSIWSSSSTCGRTFEEMEILILKKYLHPCVHCSINHSSQDMGTAQMSMDRWMHKEKVDYTGRYSAYIYKKRKSCHLQQHGWKHYAKWDEDEYTMSMAWPRLCEEPHIKPRLTCWDRLTCAALCINYTSLTKAT